MTLTYQAATHTYRLDGVVIPHVTEVLKRAGLTRWHGDLSDEAAMARGREVHRYCALLELEAVTVAEVPDAYRGYVASWAEAKAVLGLVTEDVECMVASEMYRYAGRLDWVGRYHDHFTVLDWKTGEPGPETALQTVAYDLAYREMRHLTTPCRRLALALQADGRLAGVSEYTDWQDGARFLAALAVVQCQEAFGYLTTTEGRHNGQP